MTQRVRTVAVLGVAATIVAAGIAAEWIAYGPDGWAVRNATATYPWMLDLATGCTFLAAGVVGAIRRPGSLIGPLLVLTAAAWFAATLIEPSRFIGTATAASLVFLYRGFLGHAILTFPTGRPLDRVEWAAVLVGYAASVYAPLWYGAVGGIVMMTLLVVVTWRNYRNAQGRARLARRHALDAAALLWVTGTIWTVGLLVGVPYPLRDAMTIGVHIVLMAVVVRLTLQLVRSERPDLTDLVVELGEGDASTTLRGELARLLGDPTITIGTWSASGRTYVHAGGRVLPDPETSTQADLRVDRAGEPLALVRTQRGTLDDPEVRDAVIDAVRLSVLNDQLRGKVHAQVVELAASRRRLIVAGDAEGERLRRRLREGATRQLEITADRLGAAARAARAARSAEARPVLEAVERAQQRLARVDQDLAEFELGLDPHMLSESGLEASLTDLARDCVVPVELRVEVQAVPREVAVEAYLVCAEALANASKHAHATGVRVEVARVRDAIVLTVTDDGIGGANFDGGSGLRGLADRAESLGGSLTLRSDGRHGTVLVAVLPTSPAFDPTALASTVETRNRGNADSLVNTNVLAPGRS